MNQQETATAPTWEGFRLSKQQEHVLGLDDLAKRTVARVTLSASVDRAVLENAIHDVASVHEILRTSYRKVLGENSAVLMVIGDEPKVRLAEATGDDAALAALVDAERQAAPGEDEEGALQLTVFTHADQRQSLVVSAPRASMDTVSVEIFFRDLRQAYASRVDGKQWAREDILQYADYAQWQSEEGGPNERHKVVAGEREGRLSDLPPLHLPRELRSTATTQDSLEWTVPAELAQRLRARAGEVEGGLRTVLLTGWFAALWHAAGRPDALAVSSVLTRRSFDEMVSSIGQFENPMPLFAAITDETTLNDLLRAVGTELGTHEQADERSMQPARQHARTAPGFRFSDVSGFAAQDGLAFTDLWLDPATDGRKVTLWAQGVDGGLRLTLRHQTGGMADGGAAALLTCLQATLAALAGDPSATVTSLAMLDEQAARELVAATNPAQPPVRAEAHWHRQVEQVAQRSPDATALVHGDRSWTYREFDTTANRLANELVARGVRAGDFVGLALERSDVAIVAMLAIAKAGAGYVPLDPNLPPKRRTAIVESAGLTRAVATEDTAGVLPSDIDTLLLDPEFSVARDRGDERPDVETADDSPAYVLFTSGSTGTPKGVVVGHGQLAAYLAGAVERLELTGPVDSVALGSLATDLGNTALFPPLLSGGRVVVVPAEVSSDAQALAELLVNTDYDVLKMTPTHLDTVFGEVKDPLALIPRKALVVGGEPFGWGSFNLAHSFIGDSKLFNHYGPTETTVGVLCGHVDSKEMAGLASTVPIGKPMAHARAYILDPQRRPLPLGLAGELWIGGSSVSQGYLAGTAESDERFLDDPFSPVPGARMYRSGDKARFLPDGTIEFLGRVDRQIKVRGFRVEMGEIEAVMRTHPRVQNSIVVVKGENTAAQLVGYLIDAEGTRGSADWLREYLAERLPEFMVPAHYVALDAFPMTSTGKVDANLLPEPGSYGGDESTTYVEPKTPTEQKVADIMAQLLLLKRVGAEDDFFDIGGHSLLATQLISRLRDQFEVSIKLRNLFERPVVSELAELIDEFLEKKEQDA